MFILTYKTTLKNLFRSPIFHLCVIILLGIAIYEAADGIFGYYDPAIGEMIMDTDPRFILRCDNYLKLFDNVCNAWIMLYAMPLFAVTSTVLVLTRDLDDDFFEIEKAGNVSPFYYWSGRLSALLTVNFLTVTVASFLSISCYLISRGGVEGMGLMECIKDVFVRMLREVVVMAWPAIFFYVTMTYCVGCVFKNKIIAALVGDGYIVFYYLAIILLRHNFAPVYFQYFSPIPTNLRYYMYYYDTDSFENMLVTFNTDLRKAMLALSFLIISGTAFAVISYFCIKKRRY